MVISWNTIIQCFSSFRTNATFPWENGQFSSGRYLFLRCELSIFCIPGLDHPIYSSTVRLVEIRREWDGHTEVFLQSLTRIPTDRKMSSFTVEQSSFLSQLRWALRLLKVWLWGQSRWANSRRETSAVSSFPSSVDFQSWSCLEWIHMETLTTYWKTYGTTYRNPLHTLVCTVFLWHNVESIASQRKCHIRSMAFKSTTVPQLGSQFSGFYQKSLEEDNSLI